MLREKNRLILQDKCAGTKLLDHLGRGIPKKKADYRREGEAHERRKSFMLALIDQFGGWRIEGPQKERM